MICTHCSSEFGKAGDRVCFAYGAGADPNAWPRCLLTAGMIYQRESLRASSLAGRRGSRPETFLGE